MNGPQELPDDWLPGQVALYERMFTFMIENPTMFQHPDAAPPSLEHWLTTAHNAAWHAAELTELGPDDVLIIADAATDVELAREGGMPRH